MKGHRGLTLIELLVYITIMGVVTSVAFFSIKAIQEIYFKVDARNLMTDIRYTKDLTVINGNEHRIIFSRNGYEVVNNVATVIKTYKFKPGVELSWQLYQGGNQVNYMGYTMDGNASVSGSLTLLRGNSGMKARITIAPVTGRVLLYSS